MPDPWNTYIGPCGLPHAHLAWLCDFSYEDQGFGEAYSNFIVDYDEVFYFPAVDEVDVIAFQVAHLVILCARGTQMHKLKDILRDLALLPWYNHRVGWSHIGFQLGSWGWHKQYTPLLGKVFPTAEKIVLVGHSLGAQLAAHLALYLRSEDSPEKRPIEEVCLMGEPRGFFCSSKNRYEREGLADITTSYREGSDIITKIPPWGKTTVPVTEVGRESGNDHGIKQYIVALS